MVTRTQVQAPENILTGSNDGREQTQGSIFSCAVYRHGAFLREENEFEVEALNYLHQRGVPVAYPIKRKSGGYLTEIKAPEGLRFALLTTLAEGSVPDYDSLDACKLVGQSVAQMHVASNGFTTSLKRSRLDLQGLLANSMNVIRKHLAHRPDALGTIEKIASDVCTAVRAVPEKSLDAGLCHGDLHGGNLHAHNDVVTHFDFEECAFGYRLYDVATFKWGSCIGPDSQRAKRWPAFMEGYNSIRPMSESEHSLVDSFVCVRELAETAYGIRHIRDFGHNDIMASDVDYVCFRLNKMSEATN